MFHTTPDTHPESQARSVMSATWFQLLIILTKILYEKFTSTNIKDNISQQSKIIDC
jgi:hypothetical protein